MPRRKRFKNSLLAKIMVPLLVLVIVAESALIIIRITSGPFDPLQHHPTYFVHNDKAGGDLPVVHTSGDVLMTASRCNYSDDPVEVFVNATWATVDPRGTSIVSVTDAPLVRQPGCHTDELSVDIPEAVLVRTAELRGQGHDRVVWKVSGYDTPVEADGDPGVRVYWQTNEFIVTD